MQKNTKSILQELNGIAATRNIDSLIESRGENLITSAINLIDMIYKHYDTDLADELSKRLLSSIRLKDRKKFTRCARRLAKERSNT
jgi:hypothetical protein